MNQEIYDKILSVKGNRRLHNLTDYEKFLCWLYFFHKEQKKFIIQPSNPFNERAFWANFENKSNQGIALFSVVANEYGFQFNSDLASIKVHYNSDLELTSLIFRANSSYHLLCHLLQHLSENEFTIETRRDNFMKFIKLESRISDYRDGNMLDFIL